MRRRLSLSVLPLVLVLGCTSSPRPQPTGPSHRHRVTTTLTVTADTVLPADEVRIPVMSTLVWRNRTDQPLQIDIDAAACNQCDTVLGFAPAAAGARAVALAPNGIATLCFHDAGVFAYTTRSGDRVRRGTIRVEGER
jgi:hypothetical protein